MVWGRFVRLVVRVTVNCVCDGCKLVVVAIGSGCNVWWLLLKYFVFVNSLLCFSFCNSQY